MLRQPGYARYVEKKIEQLRAIPVKSLQFCFRLLDVYVRWQSSSKEIKEFDPVESCPSRLLTHTSEPTGAL